MLPSKKKNIQTNKLIHQMSSWNILKTIHSHTQTRSSTTIIMTVRTYMMNNKQKTIHKEMGRNTHQKMLNDTRADNNTIQKGETLCQEKIWENDQEAR